MVIADSNDRNTVNINRDVFNSILSLINLNALNDKQHETLTNVLRKIYSQNNIKPNSIKQRNPQLSRRFEEIILQKKEKNKKNHSRKHSRNRLKERYGIDPTKEARQEIRQMILDGKYSVIMSKKNYREIYKLVYKEKDIYLVFDTSNNLIITFLTEKMIQNLIVKNNHPVKVENDVCYMKFGEYWFAIGVGEEIADWQWERLRS